MSLIVKITSKEHFSPLVGTTNELMLPLRTLYKNAHGSIIPTAKAWKTSRMTVTQLVNRQRKRLPIQWNAAQR